MGRSAQRDSVDIIPKHLAIARQHATQDAVFTIEP